MKTTRIILYCMVLVSLASIAIASTVPNYVSVIQNTEKWFKSAGADKFATLRMHTLISGTFQGKSIMLKEISLNGDIIKSERLLFQKDPQGNILFFGNLDESVFADPILWVNVPLSIGDTWTDSRPEVPGNTDPDNMVHYIFAVLDTKDIHCPAGTFACHRVFLTTLYPNGHIDNETFWYNPACGMVMCATDDQRIFELQKAIIPDVGDFPDVNYHDPVDGENLLGLTASPNPLNPMTNIRFELANKSGVELQVYDISGKLVRTLVRGDIMDPGTHSVLWNGKDDRGGRVASGTYIYRLRAGGSERTNRMTLIR